jgi:ubiquinone/menaquinone biosynthesis C-methylase UbiE
LHKLEELLKHVPPEDSNLSATLAIFHKYPKLGNKIMETLESHLKESNPWHDDKKMLDIGCGNGYLTLMTGMYLGFDHMYGIEIDDLRIQTAKRRGINISKINIETENLPFPDNFFTLVSSLGSLEHLIL